MGEEKERKSELIEELSELGRKLGIALKAAWESEEVRELQAQVKRALETVKESDLSRELKQGLIEALRSLNAQLDRLIASLEEKEKAQ
ncbi:MAG: hypothetical protein U9R11_00740 [Chloroflexota bacterium]|nr:hypothetical protein [Chloroflexota bacterium]